MEIYSCLAGPREVGGARWPEHPRTSEFSWWSRPSCGAITPSHNINTSQHLQPFRFCPHIIISFSLNRRFSWLEDHHLFLLLNDIVKSEVRYFSLIRTSYIKQWGTKHPSITLLVDNSHQSEQPSSDNQNLAGCYSFYSSHRITELELQSFLDLPCLDISNISNISKCCRPSEDASVSSSVSQRFMKCFNEKIYMFSDVVFIWPEYCNFPPSNIESWNPAGDIYGGEEYYHR